MPVRSSSSSVLRWPDAASVRNALRSWSRRAASAHPELLAVGLFGSYARGDWGVGSDADVVLLVRWAKRPFVERGRDWDLSSLPVAADVLVYEPGEWEELISAHARFSVTLRTEMIWLWRRGPDAPAAS